MVKTSSRPLPTNRDIFEASFSGAQDRPSIPRLRFDPPSYHHIPHSLLEFREREGKEDRERRLYDIWKSLSNSSDHNPDTVVTRPSSLPSPPPRRETSTSDKEAGIARKIYEHELFGQCCDAGHPTDRRPTHIQWAEFRKYAESKEAGEMLCLIFESFCS